LTSGLIQAVGKKTSDSHVALHGNISSPVWVTDLVKESKDVASLVLCTENIFLLGGTFFFRGVISEGLLGHLGPLCLALGTNR